MLILTYNEEPNIGRTLQALVRFPEVIILDSGSTDSTCEIAAQFSNVRIATRDFDTHASQWNLRITNCGIRRPWILALDADFVFPTVLWKSWLDCGQTHRSAATVSRSDTASSVKPLSATLYPPLVAQFIVASKLTTSNKDTRSAPW